MPRRRDPNRPKRETLTRERVLRAALVLADERGIDALSMRELGRHLRVDAMSLYNHVDNKDDLLNGIVDLVGELGVEVGDERDAQCIAARRPLGLVFSALSRASHLASRPLPSP